MKKNLITVALVALTFGAFAQAKVRFVNDSLHLVYLSPNVYDLLPGDQALAGTAYNGQVLSDGGTLVADLYAGVTPSSLRLVASGATFPFTYPGTWVPQNLDLMLQGFLPGTNYFQVQVHESGGSLAQYGLGYWGESPLFTTVANPGIAYFSIVQSSAPAYSTWAPGTFALDAVTPGAEGAIEVFIVPEPSVLALVGLGLGLLPRMIRIRGRGL